MQVKGIHEALFPVFGAQIADKITADKSNELVTSFNFGELESTKMLPGNRLQERYDKWFVTCEDKEEALAFFEKGKNQNADPHALYYRYFPEQLVAANDNVPETDPIEPAGLLAELTYPVGLLGDLVDWIVSSSTRPSRELALSAAIPFVGALIGRRFESESRLRTNFYTVGLAGSGYGKEHARSQLKLLSTVAGLGQFTGPSRFMSASALRRLVMAKPSCLCMVDEFGGMMRQITDRKAGIHNQLIRSDLLEMFSSAGTVFEGAAYADNATPEKLFNPNLCLYGTSTPEDFWASVSSLNTADGLLARFLLFNVTGPKPERITPARTINDVPESLVKACQELALSGGVGNLAKVNNGGSSCHALAVPYAEGARAELDRLHSMVEDQAANVRPQSLPILHRCVEHAIKLALTAAIADRSSNPAINEHHMAWAAKLSWHSTATLIEETRDKIADNQREADWNRLFGLIKQAGDAGIPEGILGDRSRNIDKRRREELLADMVESGRVELRETPSKGRPRRRYYRRNLSS